MHVCFIFVIYKIFYSINILSFVSNSILNYVIQSRFSEKTILGIIKLWKESELNSLFDLSVIEMSHLTDGTSVFFPELRHFVLVFILDCLSSILKTHCG